MKNRLETSGCQQSAIVQVINNGVEWDTKFKYEGTIAGHYFNGEMLLPNCDVAPTVGLLVLRGQLNSSHRVPYEVMEEDGDEMIKFERA